MPEVDGFEVLKWLNDNGYTGRFPNHSHHRRIRREQGKRADNALGADVLMSKESSPENVIYRVNVSFLKSRALESKKRVAVTIPVDFTAEGVTRTGTIINLSESGAFIHTIPGSPKGLSLR